MAKRKSYLQMAREWLKKRVAKKEKTDPFEESLLDANRSELEKIKPS